MKTKNLVPFFSSLSTKVAIIMLICVTTAVSTTSIAFLRSTEKAMERMNSNYAQTMAEDYARSIDGAALQGGFELTADIFDNLVGGTQMMGVPSSYMYVCDANGIMKYHPTASKIGQKVDNTAINGLVAEMQKGNKPAPGALVYEYSGIKKIAGFAISESNYIVVMTADYDDAMSEYTATHKHANNVNLLNIVWFTFAGLLIFKIFLKTIPVIVNIVGETADFNFKENPELIKLANRKDEIGLIAKSVKEMRSSLKEIVTDISNSSKELTSNIDDLKAGAVTINTMCTDNSATTEQLAAGMEETSATAENINGNIATMISNAKGIDELALEGEKLADDVSKRAKELKNITIDSTKKTESIYKSVKEKADSAIKNAQVVSKINEMTDQIMEISSQTSLLALNASIEAARAGESGRGFAVVATEIGNLATQTLKTVENIDAMVSEVVSSVSQMQECLEETTTFIGENVVNDYKEFEKVSDQYDSDAGEFKESMTAIRNGVTELNDTIDTVADSISGISTTINEAAHGVSGISENTHDIALKTDDTVEKANECENEITNLDDIVSKFIL